MRLFRAWESFWGYLGYLRRNRRQRKASVAKRRDLRRRHRMDTLEQRVVLNADAVDDSLTTDYQSSVVIAASQLTDNDSYSGTPTLSLPSSTAYGGSLADNYDGTYTYTPTAGFSGTDYFSYTLSDEDPSSDSATVSISVGSSPPQNNAPYANDDNYTVYAPYGSGGVTINWADYAPDLGNDSDPDGNPLSIFANNNPNSWQWIGSGQSAGYTYTVDDGQGGQATATVTVQVEEEAAPTVNNGPTAVDDYYTLTIPYGSSPYYADVSGYQPDLGNDGDPENDGLSITSNDNPGWTNVSAGSSVSFGYTITDGQGNYSSATVYINIVEDAPPTNNSPYADNAVFELRVPYGSGGGYYELSGYIPQQGTHYDDPDGDGLTLTYGGYGWTYVSPGQQYSSSYSVDDGRGGVATATVFINIVEDYAPPSIPGGLYTINEDSTLSLPTTNPSGQPLSLSVLSGPTHGSLAIDAAGLIIYTPEANYFGTDSFSCTVSDGQQTSSPATVTVEIQPIDDAPAATSDALTVPEDGSVSFMASDLLGNDSDPESGVTFVRIVQSPAYGTLGESVSGNETYFTYTPAANYCGGDSFVYEIVDGTGNLAQATVSINVTPVNDAPVAVGDDAGTMSEDDSLVVWPSDWLGNDTDDEGAPTLESVSASAGTLVANGNGSYTFTPPENFTGTTSLIYTIADSQGLTSSAAVTITVTPVNDAPTATGGAHSITEGSSLTLSSNDVDGDALLSAQVSLGPSYGNVAFADGTLTYTPSDPDFFGSDAFEYAVFDGQEWSSTVHVDVTVEPVNDAPAISAPTAQQLTTTGGMLVFSAAGGNALAVGDVEAGAKRLTLAVDHGQLSYGAGTPAQSLIISGTVAQLNAALEGLRFHAPANYAGPAALAITVDDQDATGGGPLTFTTTVFLRVQPTISIADAAASETAGGMTFTVTLSAACDQDVTVAWQTQADTADAADFTPASGMLTIAAGQTTGTITVALTNDDRDEDDQAFQLQLSNPVNGVLADAVATGLIEDDEDAPLVYVVSREVREADGTVQVLVRLSHPSEKPIQVEWHPYDGSAIRGTDGNSYDWTQGSWTSPYSQQEFLDQGGYQDVWMESTGWYPVWIPDQYGDVWVDTSHYGDVLVPSGYWNYNVWVDTSHYGDVWVDTSHWGDVWVPNLINEPIWIDDQLDEYGNVVTAGYWQENWVDHGSNVYQLITEGHNEWQWITEGHYEDQWVDTSHYETQWIVEGHYENVVTNASHYESQWTTVGWYQQQWVSNWQWTTVGYAGYWTDGGVLSFAAGVTEQVAEVTILDDSETEGNENFTIQLSNPWNVTLAPVSHGDVTILANDHAPTATITATFYEAVEQVGLALHGTGMSIDDVDAGDAEVGAGLTVTFGTLVVDPGATGVVVSGSGTAQVVFSGTLAQINALLAGSSSGTITYLADTDTPPADAQLTLAVDDRGNSGSGGALASQSSVTILIIGVNDAPTAEDNVIGLDLGTAGNFAVAALTDNDVDPDGTTPNIIDFTQPEHGNLVRESAGSFTYSPFSASIGGDHFQYTVSDGEFSATATAWLEIGPLVTTGAGAVTLATDEDTAFDLRLTRDHISGESVTYFRLSVDSGALSLGGAMISETTDVAADLAMSGFTFTPAENMAGTVTLTVTAGNIVNGAFVDCLAGSQSFGIGVQAVNDIPSAGTDSYAIAAGDTLTIYPADLLLNDSDVEDGAPGFLGMSVDSAQGTLALNGDGSYTFAPASGARGVVELTYSIQDSVGANATGTVFITIEGDDQAPVPGLAESYAIAEDGALLLGAPGLLANDTDPNDAPMQAVLVTGPQHAAEFQLNADGSFIYTPESNWNGTDTFQYRISNGTSFSSPVTATITVNPVNDAPSFQNGADLTASADDDLVTVADWATDIIAGAADEAGQQLEFVVTLAAPEEADLFAVLPQIAADGTLTFTPSGAVGTAHLSVVLRDNGGTANQGQNTSVAHALVIQINEPVSANPGNSPTATLSMADVHVNEDAGVATFTVTLTGTIERPLGFNWSVAPGTAGLGDFTNVSGILKFLPGETSKQFEVPITNNSASNGGEKVFQAQVKSYSSALTEPTAEASGFIRDDDAIPKLSITGQGADENGVAWFTVTLTGATEEIVSVDYATEDGTAQAFHDYNGTGGTLVFAANASGGTQTKEFSVVLRDDHKSEGNENFRVTLMSPRNAEIDENGAEAEVTITDLVPTASIVGVKTTVFEGESAKLKVVLDRWSTTPTTVQYIIYDGDPNTADVPPLGGTVTVLAGQLEAEFEVTTPNNSVADVEPQIMAIALDSQFEVDAVVITILDDDTDDGGEDCGCDDEAYNIVDESYDDFVDKWVDDPEYTVDPSDPDYNPPPQILVGYDHYRVEHVVKDYVCPDVTDETLLNGRRWVDFHTLSEGQEPDSGSNTQAYLEDISMMSTVNEDAGTVTLHFKVGGSGSTSQLPRIAYRTVDGTANSTDDYTAVPWTIADLALGTTDFSITIKNDDFPENDETFKVQLATPPNSTLDFAQGEGFSVWKEFTVTIKNDDADLFSLTAASTKLAADDDDDNNNQITDLSETPTVSSVSSNPEYTKLTLNYRIPATDVDLARYRLTVSVDSGSVTLWRNSGGQMQQITSGTFWQLGYGSNAPTELYARGVQAGGATVTATISGGTSTPQFAESHSAKLFVYQADLRIYSSGFSSFNAELAGDDPISELTIGAFGVANNDDSDDDGTIDIGDNDVRPSEATVDASLEKDLVRIVIRKPIVPTVAPNDLNDDSNWLQLRISQGSAMLWAQPWKGTPLTVSAGNPLKINPWTVPDKGLVLWAELTETEDTFNDEVNFALQYGPHTDLATAKTIQFDLDVDSNNDNELRGPDRSEAEDDVENTKQADQLGKVVLANLGDTDNDGVPDYADGISQLGTASSPDAGQFAPLVFDLTGTSDYSNLYVTFEYDESNPAGLALTTAAEEPPKGALRLWLKDGNEARSSDTIDHGGDFIKSGVKYRLVDMTPGFSSGLITLFMEGINPGTSIIKASVSVGANGDALTHALASDTVKVTVLDWELDLFNEVDADSADPFVSAVVLGLNDDEQSVPQMSGVYADFELLKDGQVVDLDSQQLALTGEAVGELRTSHIAGDTYSIRVRMQGTSRLVNNVRVVAGVPHSIEFSPGSEQLIADGQSEKAVSVTIRDSYGNLVADGTPVTWMVTGNAFENGAGFSNGDSRTTSGRATATLRAPLLPEPITLKVISGSCEIVEEVPVEWVSLQIVGPQTLDVHTHEVGTFTLLTNAANGSIVRWLVSNGASQPYSESIVENGRATIEIAATGNNVRIGEALVSASVGTRHKTKTFSFVSSNPFFVQIERPALSGDVVDDGTETLLHRQVQPLPYSGITYPPIETVQIPYFARSNATIFGKPNGSYLVQFADPQQAALASLIGLQENGSLLLDGNGHGTFQIRSNGAFDGIDTTRDYINLTMRVIGEDPTTGQSTERTAVIALVEHSTWTRAYDAAQSFVGGDPQTPAGIGANVAGGMLIVGDIGSLVKNLYRATGASSEKPNVMEASLSGLGLATEFAIGVGEFADAPISGVRSLVAAAGETSFFSKALLILWRRALSNAEDMAKLGKFIAKVVSDETAFLLCKETFTSDELLEAGVKLTDDFGDEFIEGLKAVGTSTSGGVDATQRITKVLAELPNNSAAYGALKQLATGDAAKYRSAMEGFGKALTEGGLDPQVISRILQRDEYFTGAYGVGDVLIDLGKTAKVNGFQKLARSVADGSALGAGQSLGRLYELRVAAQYSDEVGAANITALQRIYSDSGKLLTDVDLIVGTTYIQIKRTAEAFKRTKNVRAWITKVQNDGATTIVYVTRSAEPVRNSIKKVIQERGATIRTIDGP